MGRPTTTNSSQASGTTAEKGGRLGTFAGVFTPSILTILGIILFLRLGYVTGSSGVARALVMLGLANLVTIVTSQSLAAIATNLRVKGGGDYYLISRTLGYKFGGSIGIVLYLAQSVSVAFYCIGFGEAAAALIGPGLGSSLIAAAAVGVLFILAWLGADWATRFQYLVMVLIAAALVSFFVGGLGQWQTSIFLDNWGAPEQGAEFWMVFAVFFPAVTGFTQGVSMSGDLRDPGRSLPLGTFLAVGLSLVIYTAVIVVFAGVLTNRELVSDYQAMQRVSRWAFLIDAGVIAATLSSAMASFMGGPRILQSLAGDRIFPGLSFFAQGAGHSNNPRRAVVLTALIALAVISLGKLNLVAQVVSMFFLISYGLLNYATYFEAEAGSASFRPRFRFFNKYVSLAGCFLCLGIILALDQRNGLLALAVMFGIYLYLKRSAKPSRWADSSRSYSFRQIRKHLEQMAAIPEHHNDWYPHLLAFTNHRETRAKLLGFGAWLCGETGLLEAVKVVPVSHRLGPRGTAGELAELEEDIARLKLFCFARVIGSEDFSRAFAALLQGHGVGPLRANTVLTNWHHQPDQQQSELERLRFGHNLRAAYRLGYNLVIFHCSQSKWQSLADPGRNREAIDIWWELENDSSRLMLLLAYLMTRNEAWKNAAIRVITTSGEEVSRASERLEDFFDEARIPAVPLVVENMAPETVLSHSLQSDLVFLPFKIRQSRLTDAAGYSLERVLTQLPPTALVMAAEEIDLDAEPEEGAAGSLAEAMDELYELEKRLKRARRDEEKAAEAAAELSRRHQQAAGGKAGESGGELAAALQQAEAKRERLRRKAGKVQALHEDALNRVRLLGGETEEEGNGES